MRKGRERKKEGEKKEGEEKKREREEKKNERGRTTRPDGARRLQQNYLARPNYDNDCSEKLANHDS